MYWIFIFAFLFSCSEEDSKIERATAQYIYRKEGDFLFKPPEPVLAKLPVYPWDEGSTSEYNKITKEYFRCKGSALNPIRQEYKRDELIAIADCGGAQKHSLPLKNGKERIYPILIDLLNYIQKETKKRVVITSGHRCPDHNLYVDSSSSNQTSKHCIGAEVSFYVHGLESQPERIVKLIQNYYKQDKSVLSDKKYTEFTRYEKPDTDVSTLPWMNQEIFMKIYKKNEGRNFDNRHPYPYISLQVRYDREYKERVMYTWDKAYNNYLRY